MRKLHFFSVFLVLAFCITCQKDLRESEMATLLTNEVSISETTKNGVIVSALVVMDSSDPIIEHGFVYGTVSSPTLDLSSVLRSQELLSKTFSMTIADVLIPDTTYYVRSFAKTKSYLTYGNEVAFFSNGSMAPHIENIEPSMAFLGDTIRITGDYFDHSGKHNQVWFGEHRSTKVWGIQDTIYAVVPRELNVKRSEVAVQLYGRKSVNTKTFEIHSPVIFNISKKDGLYPDTVTIEGDYFVDEQCYLLFNSHRIETLSVSKNRVRFVVPFLEDEQKGNLKLVQFEDELLAESAFQYHQQEIFGMDDSNVLFGEPIVIHAKNIDFRQFDVHFIVNGSSVNSTYIIGYNDSLHINLPQSIPIQIEDPITYELHFTQPSQIVLEGAFRFRPPIIDVLTESLSYGGELRLKVRGLPHYYFFAGYFNGPIRLDNHSLSLSSYGDHEYAFHLPYELIPGRYTLHCFIEQIGSSNIENFEIGEPELFGVQPLAFDRSEDFIQISGNFLPVDNIQRLPLFHVRHRESQVETGISVDVDDRFVPLNLIGSGEYDLVVSYGEFQKELLNGFTFEDCFSFFNKIEDMPKVRHNTAIKLNDKVVIFEEYRTSIIDLISGSYEHRVEYNSRPWVQPYVVSHLDDLFRINTYGAIDFFDASVFQWIPIEVTGLKADVDVLFSVNEELWIIDVLGNIYMKQGQTFLFERVFPNYTNDIEHAMFFGQNLFLFGVNSVKIYDKNSLLQIDEVSYDLFDYYIGSTSLFCLGDQALILDDSGGKFYLFDFASRRFSHDEINVVPQGYSSVIYGNKKELFVMRSGVLYKYEKQ